MSIKLTFLIEGEKLKINNQNIKLAIITYCAVSTNLFSAKNHIQHAIYPAIITRLNFFYDNSDPVLVRDDNCLDWNHNKNNSTSVHSRRIALQRKADVYSSFHFGL